MLEKGRRIDRSALESHLGETAGFERHLPVATHKTTDQAERELLVRALLDIRMAIEEIRRLLLETRPGRVPLSPVGNKDEQIVEARISELPQDYNLDDLEKQQILRALDRFAGNRRKTAKALGIGERTLYRKLKEFGIE